MTGLKNDGYGTTTPKLRYSLIPPDALEELVKVLEYGAKKYSPDNWKEVENLSDRYYDAAIRHLEARRRGEKLDESGLLHSAHALCSVLFLVWKDLHPETEPGLPLD